MNKINCKIIQDHCIIKPSGLGINCFSDCDYAKDFCRTFNLSYVSTREVIDELNDILDNVKSINLRLSFSKVIEYLERKEDSE